MKKALLLVLAVMFSITVFAQTKVTGTVTSSDDGSPIPFATVLVKGNNALGGNTDLDGKYVINNVPANAVLVVSYIGYTTIEVPVNGRTVVDIVIKPDMLALDEVMVVAYGTATKGTYTGAATMVKADEIKDTPTLSFESALNGKVAGMQVMQTSGQAGSAPSIRVRGLGSMNASNEPLYVIDGVPVSSGGSGQMSDYIYSSSNIMSTLNPSDIESITVLKDAAASSLYGSRAANGVIMITTKRGKMGTPKIDFKASVAMTPTFATNNYDICGPEEQVELYYENFWNAGKLDGDSDASASASALAQLNKRFKKHGYTFSADDNTINSLKILGMTDGKENREGKYYDWDKELFRTAIYQTYDLAVSGATESTNYYTSLAYTKDQGRSVINDYDRITGRVNLSQKVGKYVEFSTNVNVSKMNRTGFNDTRSTGANYFMQSRNLLWPLYWPTDYKTGEPWTARYGSYAYNPVYYNNEWENSSKTLRLQAVEALTVNILPELKLKSIFSYDYANTMDHLYYSSKHFNAAEDEDGNPVASVHEMSTNVEKWVSSTTLNYNKTFADKHSVGFLVGFEAENNNTRFHRSSGDNLPTSSLHTVSTASVLDASGYDWGSSMASVFSRLEYNYDNRYYVSGSFRRDGSSKLGINKRWGNFWSVAGSWKINNESFMKDIAWINNLRLRASYGVNGTLPSSLYGWRALTSYGSKYMEKPGGTVSSVADANLSWETSYTYNLALEFGVLDQRLWGTIEYYSRDSKNLLQDVPISTTTGFSSILKNIGEINNSGVEIELGGDIIRTRDLTWSASLNASAFKSTVTKLYEGQTIIWYDPTGDDSRAKYIYQEGESTLAYYGREWGGVNPENGQQVWYTNNESSELQWNGRNASYDYSDCDEVIIGNAHPKLFGGINTDLTWKGLTVALGFTYKLGGQTYDAAERDNNDDGYYWERIMSQDCYDNRWTPSNKGAMYPQRIAIDMEDVNQKSSRHLHKGDYLRLKTITVGYSIPKTILSKVNISNLRVYFTGTNLLTCAAWKVYDPEVNEYGTRGWELPLGKTYTFGIELSF